MSELKEFTDQVLAVDARMIDSSGIGVYLRNLLPRIMTLCPNFRFRLYGDEEKLEFFPWTASPRVEIISWKASLYSPAEQFLLPARGRPRPALLWVPHYNIPLLWPGKIIATVHDLNHLALPNLLPGLRHRLYARFMFRALGRRADLVFCVSNFSKSELVRLAPPRRSRVLVVPNGLDEYWFTPIEGPAPHPKPFLLFVGNVKPHKNLGTLLQAMALLGPSWGYDLLVVGRREGFITMDRQYRHSADHLPGRVHFLDQLSQEQLRLCYRHARALVFPSLYEGFGFPPLEAMAGGCPVLAARTSSIPEVCAEAALYCDPLDIEGMAAALRRVCADDQLRAFLSEAGRKRAAFFSWDKAALDYADAIRKTVAGTA